MFGQVPVVTLLSRMEMGFLGIESLTSQNQFPLVLGNTFGQKNSLLLMHNALKGTLRRAFDI